MKVKVVEIGKRVVVSSHFNACLLTPQVMKDIFEKSPDANHSIIKQLDFISFEKNKEITFLNLEKSFDTAVEVLEEIDKLGFKFAPFLDLFVVNSMNLSFQKKYPNLTVVKSDRAKDYYYMAFNFLGLGGRIGNTHEIIFDKPLWYACIPK